jgi:hypothetical protein
LAEGLRAHGFEVWYDEFSLSLGDSLRRSIEHGMRHTRLGVMIPSPHFFKKSWPPVAK